MNTELLSGKIARVLQTTQPRTKARNRGLAEIKWVLTTADGRYVQDDMRRLRLVSEISEANVFDARDNEEIKVRFFGALLRQPLSVKLIS